MTKRLLISASLLAIASLCEASNLTITVHDAKGTLASNAVVWAIPQNRTVSAPSSATAIMDQRNRTFVPHVLPIQIGTSVEFPNSDNVRHQVYSFSPPKTFQLPLYIGNPANPVLFDKPGIVSIGCNIHDQMSAWIVVVDTPHFGKTGTNGRVELQNLRSGQYEIHAWHPRMTERFEPLNVTLDERTDRDLTVGIRKK